MAVFRPVTWDGSGFRDLTSAEMVSIRNEIIRLYGINPSVTLSVVSSGGNLGALSDTRLQAGAGITRVDRFATSAETQDVSTITVNYSRIDQSYSSVDLDNAGFSWPLYRASGGLRAMTDIDFYDTFIDPAMTVLTGNDNGTSTAGTYTISVSSTLSGATEVSGTATPIFTDTRADATAYTAAGLIETRDQPVNVQNYYLHRWNSASEFNFTKVICHNIGSTDATWLSRDNFRTQLSSGIQFFMSSGITYNYSTGTARGTAILNTARTSGKYLTRFVNTDDYRAQEVPDYDSLSSTINTYRLYLLRA